jgi:hypothetical protein
MGQRLWDSYGDRKKVNCVSRARLKTWGAEFQKNKSMERPELTQRRMYWGVMPIQQKLSITDTSDKIRTQVGR